MTRVFRCTFIVNDSHNTRLQRHSSYENMVIYHSTGNMHGRPLAIVWKYCKM